MAVVGEGGRLIAFSRMDRARPVSVDIALNKAYTAATFQLPIIDLSGLAGQSWFKSLIVSTQGKIMAVAGGLPVLDSPNVVGAVCVSGGTDEQDLECCRAAVPIADALSSHPSPPSLSRPANSESLTDGPTLTVLMCHQEPR